MKRPSSKIDDALNVLASALGGSITHGTEINGRLLEYGGELEVEITMRVKRPVSMADTNGYRARAMVLLASAAWNDRCPHWVKKRDSFSSLGTVQCSGKVTAVIVRKGYADMSGPVRPGEYRPQLPSERFEFVCNHHADVVHPDVIAIVRLEQTALRALRARREREAAEARAREALKERELEAEVAKLPDSDLNARLAEAVAAHRWGLEDICMREQRRRARLTKPAAPPVSMTGGKP